MYVELVDTLRCPNAHRESWLVASADRIEGRDIVAGVLGCPVCREQFAIAGGIADFRRTPGTRGQGSGPDESAERAMRLAALLDLADAGGFAVLCGEWTVHAAAMRALTGTHLLLVNPPAGVTVGEGTSGVAIDEVFPLAARSARGVALDASASAALVESALRVVAPRGRVVAPVSIVVPTGITEVARDASVWVGVRDAAVSEIVAIHGPRRSPEGTAGSR